jgi:hypothetical protein
VVVRVPQAGTVTATAVSTLPRMPCSRCSAIFTSPAELHRHMLAMHPTPVTVVQTTLPQSLPSCHACQGHFANQMALRRHKCVAAERAAVERAQSLAAERERVASTVVTSLAQKRRAPSATAVVMNGIFVHFCFIECLQKHRYLATPFHTRRWSSRGPSPYHRSSNGVALHRRSPPHRWCISKQSRWPKADCRLKVNVPNVISR